MKHCPKCDREYSDESLNFCLEDGETLVQAELPSEARTAIQVPEVSSAAARPGKTSERTAILPRERLRAPGTSKRTLWLAAAVSTVILAAGSPIFVEMRGSTT